MVVKMENDGYKRLIIFLFVTIGILSIIVFLMIYDNYKETKNIELNQKDKESFDEGAQYGYLVAVTTIMENLKDCNVIPLNYNNFTVNIVDVNCVR